MGTEANQAHIEAGGALQAGISGAAKPSNHALEANRDMSSIDQHITEQRRIIEQLNNAVLTLTSRLSPVMPQGDPPRGTNAVHEEPPGSSPMAEAIRQNNNVARGVLRQVQCLLEDLEI